MRKALPTIISLIVVVVMVAGATWLSRRSNPSEPAGQAARVVGIAELKQANGKLGVRCWVAVDGTVYEIANSPNWQDGEHVTSEGQAFCGADLSNVIDRSPHGRKILDQLTVVGRLGD